MEAGTASDAVDLRTPPPKHSDKDHGAAFLRNEHNLLRRAIEAPLRATLECEGVEILKTNLR
jgi:hypothetical protein